MYRAIPCERCIAGDLEPFFVLSIRTHLLSWGRLLSLARSCPEVGHIYVDPNNIVAHATILCMYACMCRNVKSQNEGGPHGYTVFANPRFGLDFAKRGREVYAMKKPTCG